MKHLPTILVTSLITTVILFILVRIPWTGAIILTGIDPVHPTHEFVLTKDSKILAGNDVVGTLKAGQILYPPTRHDQMGIFKPRHMKIYVQVHGSDVILATELNDDLKVPEPPYSLHPLLENEIPSGR